MEEEAKIKLSGKRQKNLLALKMRQQQQKNQKAVAEFQKNIQILIGQ